MYSPSLQHLMLQAHIQELHRARQSCSLQPITTNERIAARHRNAAKLFAVLGRAIDRFGGQPDPSTHAF